MPETFEHWVTKVAVAGDNPRGDFIRDTREVIDSQRWADGEVTTLSQLRSKMMKVGAPCHEAIVEAETCWAQYTRHNAADAAA